MTSHNLVNVNKRNRILIPAIAREKLKIERGDHLLVDIQDGFMILMLEPDNYTARLAGLHHEIWERDAWGKSLNDPS